MPPNKDHMDYYDDFSGWACPTTRIDKIRAEISGVASMYEISSKDLQFMRNIYSQPSLTPNQELWLSDIEEKIFGEPEED